MAEAIEVTESVPKRAVDLFERGQGAADRENYDYAITLYLEALYLAPTFVTARKRLREIELQKWNSARKYWQAASALSPDKAQPHVRLGTLAFQRGQLDQAERLFRVAGKLQEDCGEAYGGLAMICQHRGDHSDAFEMYLKCLELDTDNLVALLGLFQTSCRMGSFSKIIHYLEVYLENNPSDASVLFCLASLYAREGRLWRARQAVRQALKEAPDKQDAKDLLAELEEALADADNGVDARL